MNSNKLEDISFFMGKKLFEKYVWSCKPNAMYTHGTTQELSGVFLVETPTKNNYYREKNGVWEVCWFLNGILHREDGPARISSYGCWWYKQHRLDRLNGPAHCYVDAITGEYNEYYWLNNTKISETEYWNNPEVIKHKLKKIIEL
mgnify:CR=1 FL=1